MSRREFTICSVQDCDRRVTGQGLCNLHYRRMRRHGDPLGGRPTFKGDPLAFLEAAIAANTDDCIIWPFSIGGGGYGTMFLDGKYHNVSRLALEKAEGPPPATGMVAAHKPVICHNRACINKRHLRWSTSRDNADDMVADGTRLLGESTNSVRLSADQVKEIRKDERSHVDVAEAYGVTRRNVAAIRERRTWGWLND